MVDLPTRYYVQRSQSHSTSGPPQGWETVIVTFDRATAERYAESFERGMVFEDGEDISNTVKTVARVMTAEELNAKGGDALIRAEIATRIQFWQKLQEWAEPLIESDRR